MTSYSDPKHPRLEKILDCFIWIVCIFFMIVIYGQDKQIAELKAELELKEQEK